MRRSDNSNPNLDRRELLKLFAGIGAGLALAPGVAGARAAWWPDAYPADLVTKPIPSSGEHLPVIGIGTARRYSPTSDAERAPLLEVVRSLPRLGGKVIDTAPSYGSAESTVGTLVAEAGNRDRLFLATKVGRGDQGVEAGVAEMESSFKQLRTDKIDLMQVHNLNGVDVMLPVLRDWKQQGRIRYYGVTTSSDRQYADLERVLQRDPMDFVQVDYAIDNREVERRILPLAADRGIAVLVNLPFGRGRVLDKFKGQELPDWAKAIGIQSWAQFALKYLVSHPAVTVAIPGTATTAYLADNLGAGQAPMPDAATRQRMAALVAGG